MSAKATTRDLVVHLVDGTYELFRHHYALPDHRNAAGEEVAATRGVVGSMLRLLEEGATHVGVATDHVVESFRNDLYDGYKTGEGIDPELFAQFPMLEDALEAAGFVVWRMVEHEADDGLASAAAQAAADRRVAQVRICTPDKDLGQCVVGQHVVQVDRRKELVLDEAAVTEKFGVPPASIADYLGLVGDSADGFPGIAGWGAKSAAAVLARWGHIEDIPDDPADWDVQVRGAARLAATLDEGHEDALLFKRIATVVTDIDLGTSIDDLRWRGPTDAFATWAERLDAPRLLARAQKLASSH
jgi:5'-3' exonuclease